MYKFIVILFGMFAGNGCSGDFSRLDMALRLAGDNQAELLKALNHYSKERSDTLKFKALVFLIENMPGHFSYGGESFEAYTDRLREMKDVSPYTCKVLQSVFNRSGLLVDQQEIQEDIRHITSDFLIRHIECKFEMWQKLPWLGKLNFDEFCEYVLPYRIENEIPEQIQDTSFVNRKKNEEIIRWYDDVNYSAQGVCHFYFPKFFYFERRLPYPFGYMYKFDCYDTGLLQLYHYRASGIPAALDFVPAWGNTNGCHYWVAVIDGMYTSTLVQPVIYRKIPKVYRYTFSRQDTLKDQNYVPELFRQPFVRDVTSEYIHTADIRFRPALAHQGIKYVYLAVFNNCRWEPSGYKISTNIENFKEEVGNYLKSTYEIKKFEITEINYVQNIYNGYVAFIYYLIDKGLIGNIIKSSIPLKLKGIEQIERSHVMTKTNKESAEGQYWYCCIQKLGKVCEVGCALCSYEPNVFQCTCVDECAILVTEQP